MWVGQLYMNRQDVAHLGGLGRLYVSHQDTAQLGGLGQLYMNRQLEGLGQALARSPALLPLVACC